MPCRPEARRDWGITTMKRHLFTEDTRSFHICLCLHFKVPLTGCLRAKRKGRVSKRRRWGRRRGRGLLTPRYHHDKGHCSKTFNSGMITVNTQHSLD